MGRSKTAWDAFKPAGVIIATAQPSSTQAINKYPGILATRTAEVQISYPAFSVFQPSGSGQSGKRVNDVEPIQNFEEIAVLRWVRSTRTQLKIAASRDKFLDRHLAYTL
jgi:hypothetical protein